MKQVRRKRYWFRLARFDDIDTHCAIIYKPGMEKLNLKEQVVPSPESLFRLETNASPLIIVDLGQKLGEFSRLLKRLLREEPGFFNHVLEFKGSI